MKAKYDRHFMGMMPVTELTVQAVYDHLVKGDQVRVYVGVSRQRFTLDVVRKRAGRVLVRDLFQHSAKARRQWWVDKDRIFAIRKKHDHPHRS